MRQEGVAKAENSHLTCGSLKPRRTIRARASCGLGMTLPSQHQDHLSHYTKSTNDLSEQSSGFPSLSLENAPVPPRSCRVPGCAPENIFFWSLFCCCRRGFVVAFSSRANIVHHDGEGLGMRLRWQPGSQSLIPSPYDKQKET